MINLHVITLYMVAVGSLLLSFLLTGWIVSYVISANVDPNAPLKLRKLRNKIPIIITVFIVALLLFTGACTIFTVSIPGAMS
jgi:hypothetical protein